VPTGSVNLPIAVERKLSAHNQNGAKDLNREGPEQRKTWSWPAKLANH